MFIILLITNHFLMRIKCNIYRSIESDIIFEDKNKNLEWEIRCDRHPSIDINIIFGDINKKYFKITQFNDGDNEYQI